MIRREALRRHLLSQAQEQRLRLRLWAVAQAKRHNSIERLIALWAKNYTARFISADDILGGKTNRLTREGLHEREWKTARRTIERHLSGPGFATESAARRWAESRRGREAAHLRRALAAYDTATLDEEQLRLHTILSRHIKDVPLRRAAPEVLQMAAV